MTVVIICLQSEVIKVTLANEINQYFSIFKITIIVVITFWNHHLEHLPPRLHVPPQPVQPSSLEILVLSIVVIFNNSNEDNGDDNYYDADAVFLPSHVNIRSTPKREGCHNSLKWVALEKDQWKSKRINENCVRINDNGKAISSVANHPCFSHSCCHHKRSSQLSCHSGGKFTSWCEVHYLRDSLVLHAQLDVDWSCFLPSSARCLRLTWVHLHHAPKRYFWPSPFVSLLLLALYAFCISWLEYKTWACETRMGWFVSIVLPGDDV